MGLIKIKEERENALGGMQTGQTTITAETLLGITDNAITPTNPGEFTIYRTVPVLPAARSFSEVEANALERHAAKRKIQAKATKKAVNALIEVKDADTSEHKDYNRYREHEARKTYQQVKSNAITGNAIASLASKYGALHESVQHRLEMEKAKMDAITGTGGQAQQFAQLW